LYLTAVSVALVLDDQARNVGELIARKRRNLSLQIAIHQLVDRGLASLHDETLVGHYVPEIALDKLEILEGWDDEQDKPILRKATKSITLAMLLSHSAGKSALLASLTCCRLLLQLHEPTDHAEMA
jgi:CubicO group peptidase (beta-lactamase class C family)